METQEIQSTQGSYVPLSQDPSIITEQVDVVKEEVKNEVADATEQVVADEGGIQYDLEGFNKHFESDFENESSLKDFLSNREKLGEYETQLSQKDEELQSALEKAQKYDTALEFFDPAKFYGEEDIAYMELKRKYPDKDPNLLLQIRGAQFDTMSDIDKLVLADKLNVPSNVSDEVRRSAILERLGVVSDDLSELSPTDEYRISSALVNVKSTLSEIKEFKPDSNAFNFIAEKKAKDEAKLATQEDLKNKWTPIAQTMLKNFEHTSSYGKDDKGNSVETFKYSVDDKFREEFTAPLMEAIIKSNIEPTQDNLKMVGSYLDERFRVANFDRIVSEAIKHGKSLASEAVHKEIHNDGEQNTQEAPPRNEGSKGYSIFDFASKRK